MVFYWIWKHDSSLQAAVFRDRCADNRCYNLPGCPDFLLLEDMGMLNKYRYLLLPLTLMQVLSKSWLLSGVIAVVRQLHLKRIGWPNLLSGLFGSKHMWNSKWNTGMYMLPPGCMRSDTMY